MATAHTPLDQRLEQILARRDELESLLATAAPAEYVGFAREYAGLESLVAGIGRYRDVRREAAGLEAMLTDPAVEPEMRSLVEEELRELQGRLPDLERDIRLLLLPKDIADEKDAILEVRAGTGGDEAALFAGDLLRMYQRYAELKGWRVEVISLAESDLGGVREAVLGIGGNGVFAPPQFEAGVPPVQPVPPNETPRRNHTPAPTLAGLPPARQNG